MTGKDILKIKFESSDLNKTVTIKQYLKTFISTAFEEGEGFSGKRPFGNSGWTHDIEVGLVKAGVLKGELDEDGFLQSVEPGFDDLIQKAIKAL